VVVVLPPFESNIFEPNLAPPPNTVLIALAALAAIVFYAAPTGLSTSDIVKFLYEKIIFYLSKYFFVP